MNSDDKLKVLNIVRTHWVKDEIAIRKRLYSAKWLNDRLKQTCFGETPIDEKLRLVNIQLDAINSSSLHDSMKSKCDSFFRFVIKGMLALTDTHMPERCILYPNYPYINIPLGLIDMGFYCELHERIFNEPSYDTHNIRSYTRVRGLIPYRKWNKKKQALFEWEGNYECLY